MSKPYARKTLQGVSKGTTRTGKLHKDWGNNNVTEEKINKLTGEKVWAEIRNIMQEKFVRGEFCKGILFGIDEIGKILAQHFPISHDDTNEIPNRVVIQN